MPRVFIPPLMRNLTNGTPELIAPGETVSQVVDQLDSQYPGFRQRLCDGDILKPDLTVVVDSSVAPQGLRAKVAEESEIHFLPAVGGG